MPQRFIKDRHSGTIAALRAKEIKIQQAFVESFDLLAGPQAFLFSVPNERGDKNLSQLIKAGLRPGMTDIVIVWEGGGLFLEFKARNGTVTENQEKVHSDLRALRWPVEIVRSVDEAWAALATHGCPVRALLTGGTARRAG
ncbi:MAG: VRR-NUC domain-containing protein [Pseudomonadota bacterium]